MLMRKPSFTQFGEFKRIFDRINREENLRQQIIPYFISSHPGCHEEDMAELAVLTKNMDFQLEQVQDFTPTPMTVATEMWYTGYNPYTLEPVFSAKTPQEKQAQRQFFFWYKPEERRNIANALRRMNRKDLLDKLYHDVQPQDYRDDRKQRRDEPQKPKPNNKKGKKEQDKKKSHFDYHKDFEKRIHKSYKK